jgi:hypothetical protein
MRGSEYIIGKFAGNFVFLSVFTGGYMLTAMAMVLVRGEGALDPWMFAKQYLLLMPPAIAFVSAAAIWFESTPLLRSKAGDVFYFFLWLGLMGGVGSQMDKGGNPGALIYFDISGFGMMMSQLRQFYDTNSMSIGASDFDAAKGTVDFAGLHADPHWIFVRVITTLLPLSLLFLARLFFHRFDPARVRAVPNEKARRSWIGRLNFLAKPLARLLVRMATPFAGNAAMTDALTTIAAFPLTVVAMIGFAIAALASDANALFTGVMPLALAACAIAIADISSREKRAGTTALVYATPRLRTQFVWWKFASTLIVALAFLAVPLARGIALRPSATIPLLVGILFTAAASTALGIISANPKTFIVGFLSFWYIATQDKGHSSSLDFAGWFAAATPLVITLYALGALLLVAAAHVFHTNELRRRW